MNNNKRDNYYVCIMCILNVIKFVNNYKIVRNILFYITLYIKNEKKKTDQLSFLSIKLP